MIFSKPLTICAILGYLYSSVNGAAYEIQINGQVYQVNVINQGGESYGDRTSWSDDYGALMDDQKEAICSSLRMDEYCESVTNNGAKTHNLFNYFPNHATESIVAHANDKYNKNNSPYLLRQPMDDRTISSLSRQNPHYLGTMPIKPKMTQSLFQNTYSTSNVNSQIPLDQIAQLFDATGFNTGGSDPLQHVTTKKFKYKKNKNKNPSKNQQGNNNELATNEDIENSEDEEGDYEAVEVELYSNINDDQELANALGIEDGEVDDTIDRIVAQVVASYLDNDSEEVDVGQIFANEVNVVGNGDVSVEELDIDDGSMHEMGELLDTIRKKHKKKIGANGEEIEDNEEYINGEEQDIDIYGVKFSVDSDDNDQDDEEEQEL